MRALSELRALAVQISKLDDVHVQVDENHYGWHVVVRAGQPSDETEDGYLLWSATAAPIMVAATAPTLNAVIQQAYSTLQFEVLTNLEGTP